MLNNYNYMISLVLYFKYRQFETKKLVAIGVFQNTMITPLYRNSVYHRSSSLIKSYLIRNPGAGGPENP